MNIRAKVVYDAKPLRATVVQSTRVWEGKGYCLRLVYVSHAVYLDFSSINESFINHHNIFVQMSIYIRIHNSKQKFVANCDFRKSVAASIAH